MSLLFVALDIQRENDVANDDNLQHITSVQNVIGSWQHHGGVVETKDAKVEKRSKWFLILSSSFRSINHTNARDPILLAKFAN